MKKVASEIVVDVSKFLRFACGWFQLGKAAGGLCREAKRVSIGPKGQLAKLDALCCALRSMQATHHMHKQPTQ